MSQIICKMHWHHAAKNMDVNHVGMPGSVFPSDLRGEGTLSRAAESWWGTGEK